VIVPAASVASSQFSDTYRPVFPLTPTAYEIPSRISPDPAVPANAGAVPITVTLPETAASHVEASLTAAAGGLLAQDPLEGSPITRAEYAAN
jgi:hypothetical protein